LLVFHTQESETLYLDQIYGYRLYARLDFAFLFVKAHIMLVQSGLQWLGCKTHVSFVYFLFDRQLLMACTLANSCSYCYFLILYLFFKKYWVC